MEEREERLTRVFLQLITEYVSTRRRRKLVSPVETLSVTIPITFVVLWKKVMSS